MTIRNYRLDRKQLDTSSKKISVKIALLSSYTIKSLEDPLYVLLHERGIHATIKTGDYGAIEQQLISPASWLKEFAPEMIVVALSANTLFPHIAETPLQERRAYVSERMNFLLSALRSYTGSASLLVTTLEHPHSVSESVCAKASEDSVFSLITWANTQIACLAAETKKIFLLDFASMVSEHGLRHTFDPKFFYLGKILLSPLGFEQLAILATETIAALYGREKKCFVVDLDNTLWGGVVGEDGIDNLQIGTDGIGAAYGDVQKLIKQFSHHGILLAICSKNNPEDALAVFKKRPEMILKETDFSCMRINWESKAKNIQEIAEELNIGLDSMVFLDDNPAERLAVTTTLPQVICIGFPKDITQLPSILKSCKLFTKLSLTEEDSARNQMYHQDSHRKALQNTTLNLTSYLHDLQTKILVVLNPVGFLDRVSQLINKTNQFNLRTVRYTIEQVRVFMQDPAYHVFSLSVSDRFGDLGLTGVLIFHAKNNTEVFVDTFLMSCRILSRDIERQFFLECINKLNCDKITAEYIPTEKNSLAKDFYDDLGFTLIKEDHGKKEYSLKLPHAIASVPWIKVSN